MVSPSEHMLKLEDIKKNAAIAGIELGQIVHNVTTEPVGDNALTIYYKTPEGALRERMLFHMDETSLSFAESADALSPEDYENFEEACASIERIAMQVVIEAERALGHEVIDLSAQKCVWDVTSIPKGIDGRIPPSRNIEVKGWVKGATAITVTRNEILYGLNQADKFILAVVLANGDNVEGPHYIRRSFTQEPDWAVTSINLDLNELLGRSTAPCA